MVKQYGIAILSIVALCIASMSYGQPISSSNSTTSPKPLASWKSPSAQADEPVKVTCPATLKCDASGFCGAFPAPWVKTVYSAREPGNFSFVSAQAADKSWPSQAQCNYKKDELGSHTTAALQSGINKLQEGKGNWGAGIYPWYDTCPSLNPADCEMLWSKPKDTAPSPNNTPSPN